MRSRVTVWHNACSSELQYAVYADGASAGEEQEYYDSEAYTCLCNLAFGGAAVLPVGTGTTVVLVVFLVRIVVGVVLIWIARLSRCPPDCYGNEGGEPEESVEEIDRSIRIDICEAVKSRPYGDQNLVGQAGKGEEALQRIQISTKDPENSQVKST